MFIHEQLFKIRRNKANNVGLFISQQIHPVEGEPWDCSRALCIMYFRDRTSAKDWWKDATPLHEGQDLLGALDAVVVDLCAFPPGDSEYTHYSNVIMSTMASQITSLTIIYSTVYSAAVERNHQSSASPAFMRGPVYSPHNGTVTRKMFPFDDVIMDIDVVLYSKCREVWRDLDGHFYVIGHTYVTDP